MVPTQSPTNLQLTPCVFGAGEGKEQSRKAAEVKNGVFNQKLIPGYLEVACAYDVDGILFFWDVLYTGF